MAPHQKSTKKKLSEGEAKVAAHAQSGAKKGNPPTGNLLRQGSADVPANAQRAPKEGSASLGLLKEATAKVPAIAKSAAK